MLIVLMYHRVSHTHSKVGDQALVAFARHLAHLAEHYSIVLPGDRLSPNKIQICLTFDDAYFDFYHHVFPLLRQLQIPALLAIPSGLILETTRVDKETRLTVPYLQAMDANKTHATLCTWEEIREMLDSSLVMAASHGLTHKAISEENFEEEVVFSKEFLEEKTGVDVNTFVYPYGSLQRSLHKRLLAHYQYGMRIGSSWNFNWSNCHKMIYRINADNFWTEDRPMLDPKHQLTLSLRFLSNTLRFK